MEECFIDLKSSLIAIDQSPDFTLNAIESKISLLSECVRNILMPVEPEISQIFDEGFRNPHILAGVIQDDSTINIMVKILESMANELVREDLKAKVNNIILYFKSEI